MNSRKKETYFQSQIKSAVNIINRFWGSQESLTNKQLIKLCCEQGIKLIGNEQQTHLLHELLETAVNLHITEIFTHANLIERNDEKKSLHRLTKLLEKLPPQSWRGREQIRLQQFSTPPTIAYLMARLLKPTEEESVLEPSAGTGSLAVWLKIARCRFHVNEISETRRLLLELQGYAPTGFNAEFLNDTFPNEIRPDAVLMNPPFSSSGGRTKANSSSFGFRHISAAMQRLKPGGRMAALIGTESGIKTDQGKRFWSEFASEYELRAVIHLPKNAFYKYGTSIGTSIICALKNPMPEKTKPIDYRKKTLEVNCHTLDEVLAFVDVFD